MTLSWREKRLCYTHLGIVWPVTLLCPGLRGFLGCRTFSAKFGTPCLSPQEHIWNGRIYLQGRRWVYVGVQIIELMRGPLCCLSLKLSQPCFLWGSCLPFMIMTSLCVLLESIFHLLISSVISGHYFFLNVLSSLDHLNRVDPSICHAIVHIGEYIKFSFGQQLLLLLIRISSGI